MTFLHTAVESMPPVIAVATVKPDVPVDVPEQKRTWGVVTINCIDFKPNGVRSRPPSIADTVGGNVASMFAYAFNSSGHAKCRRRWMLLTDTGSILTLSDIPDEDRPNDPAAFPPIVLGGLTKAEALNVADDLNRPRFKLARVPRQWSIPVMPISQKGSVTE